MSRTLSLDTVIPSSRRLEIELPEDFPAGHAHIVLEVMTDAERSSEEELDLEDARRSLAEAEAHGTTPLAELKSELGL